MAPADPFEAQRPRLRALAYRMLGSWSDAEDVVQDAYLRWRGAQGDVEAAERWLPRVVVNLCLDLRKSSRARREAYVGEWLPEPVATADGRLGGEPVDADEVSLAFLALLERLSPLERAAYVLHEAFDYDPREIGEVLGKNDAAVRQLLHRAREHVEAARPRYRPSDEARARILGAFVGACVTGDLAALKAMLADDAVAVSDGGGKARAALKAVSGADRVARLMLGVVAKRTGTLGGALRAINGAPGFVATVDGVVAAVVQLELEGERVRRVLIVSNPEKLRHIE